MKTQQIDLLIITPSEFKSAIAPLEVFKNQTGIVTATVVLEDVYQQYAGRDEAEKVKKCLAEYRTKAGIRYALLVGDCEKFPVRYTKTDRKTAAAHDTAFYPADLYYADLFNQYCSFDDWDRNKNGYYGELTGESQTGKLNLDEVDIRPDIAVGRIPVSTNEEVSNYVAKVMMYELGAAHSSWANNALLLASVNWVKDACKRLEDISKDSLKTYNCIKMYGKGNPCMPTTEPSAAAINTYLNSGVGFVAYAGHGSRSGWEFYGVNDLSGMTTEKMLPVMFSAGCSTSEFATLPPYDAYADIKGNYHKGTNYGEVFTSTPPQPACLQAINNTEGFGENILIKRKTGAVAYVGCITGSQPTAVDLLKFFFESLNQGFNTLGSMWNYMIQRYYEVFVPPVNVNKPDWTIVANFHQPWKFFLMGDPSLRIGGIREFQKEDCISIDYNKIEVKKIGRRWKIVQGDMWILDFGSSESEARKAYNILTHYKITSQCFVGRPDASMEYYLVNGASPVGAFSGEDCIGFNPAAVVVKKVGGRWKIVEGGHWILDFNHSEEEAKKALGVIQKYGFNHICFVGRPDASLTYFRR